MVYLDISICEPDSNTKFFHTTSWTKFLGRCITINWKSLLSKDQQEWNINIRIVYLCALPFITSPPERQLFCLHIFSLLIWKKRQLVTWILKLHSFFIFQDLLFQLNLNLRAKHEDQTSGQMPFDPALIVTDAPSMSFGPRRSLDISYWSNSLLTSKDARYARLKSP